MSRFDAPTPHPAGTRDLHICASCRMPFVVPVSILDIDADGRCIVELTCANCEATLIGLHDEHSLEALDVELDRATLRIQEALDALVLAEEIDRIDRFATALHDDLILPEDF